MADDILDVLEVGLILHLRDRKIIEHESGERAVIEFMQEIRDSYGGQRCWIKRKYRKYPPRVVEQIKSEFNGRNGKELRAKYGMSNSVFYHHIKNSG